MLKPSNYFLVRVLRSFFVFINKQTNFMEAQLMEFLTQNPGSKKAVMSEAGMKGLALFNAIKKLLNEGKIIVAGEGADATYTVCDTTVSSETPAETQDEQTERTDEQAVEEETQEHGELHGEQTTANEEVEEEVKPAGRDNSKYKFNGQQFGKGPLVLALVKKYVEDNPDTTFKQLTEKFPPTLMKRFGVVCNEQEAIKLSGKKPRYFLKHPIKIKGQKEPIVVCNQWTAALMVNFLSVVKALGYKIK